MELSRTEIRVLGALMEKARTTPDAYPLTLNSLVLACNQKTSRDPVTNYDEDEVEAALESLREKHMAMRVDMAGSRTAKFRENASKQWDLGREEYAVLTILLLRGPQTPGQLRQRCERLFPFAELQQVTDCLVAMQKRDEEPLSLVKSLGRAPGTKEIRYSHILASPDAEDAEYHKDQVPDFSESSAPEPMSSLQHVDQEPANDRLSRMEASILELEQRVTQLEQLLNELTS